MEEMYSGSNDEEVLVWSPASPAEQHMDVSRVGGGGGGGGGPTSTSVLDQPDNWSTDDEDGASNGNGVVGDVH